MKSLSDLREAWDKACHQERAAWEQVKDKLPGSPRFDAGLWAAWRDALSALDAARNDLTQALDGPSQP